MSSTQKIASKLPNVGATIFSTMSALASKHDAVNLSQGFPDFTVDPVLIELVNKYMKAGYNQYAPYAGVEALRKVLANKMAKDHGHAYDPEQEVNITAGATQAIATIITATIKEGDEVILFTPAYDCYVPYIQLNGGTPVYVELTYPDYKVDWEQVKKLINHRTKMIVVNTPHNPSATVFKSHDLDKLVEITSGSDILILADEVYEHIVFDEQKHLSISSRPELVERSFIVGSLGKTLHITGWKTGFCMAPEPLMREFRKTHQFMVFSVNTPIQYALAEYLEDEINFEIKQMYESKRDTFLKAIEGSRFKPLHSQGSYFQLLDYSTISDELDVDFAKYLTVEKGIASIPLSVFYPDQKDYKVLRFCFAKGEDTLQKAGELLQKV
jgi:methionine aminotransferase